MIYDSKHISILYRAFINDELYVYIECDGAVVHAEVNAIGLVVMLVEDMLLRNEQLTVHTEILREGSIGASENISIIQGKSVIESVIERNKDMVISILTECNEDDLPTIRTSLKEYLDGNSWQGEYNLLETNAAFGKPSSVVKLEEQYA